MIIKKFNFDFIYFVKFKFFNGNRFQVLLKRCFEIILTIFFFSYLEKIKPLKMIDLKIENLL